MGTKKISELQELETLNNNDLIPVVDTENESTKKVAFGKFANYVENYVDDALNALGEIQYPTYATGADMDINSRSNYLKIGHLVNVSINMSGVTSESTAYTILFTLPEGYRPKYNTYGQLRRRGYFSNYQLLVATNGNVIIYTNENISNYNICGNISFYSE